MRDVSPSSAEKPSDEIDLYALLSSLYAQKSFIAAIMLGCLLMGAAYAFLVPAVFQTTSVLRPVSSNELDALNRSEAYELSPIEGLERVGAALESYGSRLAFFRARPELFEAYQLPGMTMEQSFERFNERAMTVSIPEGSKAGALGPHIRVTYVFPSGVQGAKTLNEFILYVMDEESRKISQGLKVIVANRTQELEQKILAARAHYGAQKEARIAVLLESDQVRRAQLQDELEALRAQLLTQRQNRIALLDEAISVAKSLGIKKPAALSSFGDIPRPRYERSIHAEVNNSPVSLYFLGTDALQAERQTLVARDSDDVADPRISQILKELQMIQFNREVEEMKQRKNEEYFLSDIEPSREELARLRDLDKGMQRLHLAVVDQTAQDPLRPIKPKKLLIIVLSLVLGGMFGVLAALVRAFLRVRQSLPLVGVAAEPQPVA